MEEQKTIQEDNKEEENLSIIQQTNLAAERVEKANKLAQEILKQQQELYAEEKLSGTGGGKVEREEISEAELKKKEAKEMFKGTSIEQAINKYNE